MNPFHVSSFGPPAVYSQILQALRFRFNSHSLPDRLHTPIPSLAICTETESLAPKLLRQNFSSASRAALYEKLRTCKAMLRRERQEKLEMKDASLLTSSRDKGWLRSDEGRWLRGRLATIHPQAMAMVVKFTALGLLLKT